jgi:hypothetical protein
MTTKPFFNITNTPKTQPKFSTGEYVLYNGIPFRIVAMLPGKDFALIGFNFDCRYQHNGRPVPVNELAAISKKTFNDYFIGL